MTCPEASLGWGVPLTDAPVGWAAHPSIRPLIQAGSPLLDAEPQGAREDYWRHVEIVTTGYAGHPRSAPAACLRRSLTTTADSTADVDPAGLAPPTAAETDLVRRYLDEAGFTGDRTIRLLLTARET